MCRRDGETTRRELHPHSRKDWEISPPWPWLQGWPRPGKQGPGHLRARLRPLERDAAFPQWAKRKIVLWWRWSQLPAKPATRWPVKCPILSYWPRKSTGKSAEQPRIKITLRETRNAWSASVQPPPSDYLNNVMCTSAGSQLSTPLRSLGAS